MGVVLQERTNDILWKSQNFGTKFIRCLVGLDPHVGLGTLSEKSMKKYFYCIAFAQVWFRTFWDIFVFEAEIQNKRRKIVEVKMNRIYNLKAAYMKRKKAA